MNIEITTEYAIAGMIFLPLLVGISVWMLKDRKLLRERNGREADRRVHEKEIQNLSNLNEEEKRIAQQQSGSLKEKDSELQELRSKLQSEAGQREADRRVHEKEIQNLYDTIKKERHIAQQQINSLKEAEEAMTKHFKALSGDVLRHNSEEFRKQASNSFKQQQENTEQSISGLIKPITEALKKTEEQIQAIEKSRHEAFGSLSSQIRLVHESSQQLQSETRNLVTALRRPEVRGKWGELTLKRLVELAGMVEHCDFVEQESGIEEGRVSRPDMIVRMPDQRELIVDAKTPLDAYLSAMEAQDAEQRQQFLVQHARNMRKRVDELSRKAYWSQFKNSPDYVVLFIPGEQFLTAALEQDSRLLEDALQNRVVLSTPTTIIALLRAVAFGWRQVTVAENAEKIQKLGEELYKRVTTFIEHLDRVGKNLHGSVDAYNKAIGSLERQVLPGMRKFEELGIQSKKQLEEPQSLAQVPRSAGHLVNQDD